MTSDADMIRKIKEAEEKSQIEIESARKEHDKKIMELVARHNSEVSDLHLRLDKEFQRSQSILAAKTQEYREKVMKEARTEAAALKLNLTDKDIKKIVNSMIAKIIGE